MQCEDAQNQLNARADGELASEDGAALDAHVRECADCQLADESLRAMGADLRRAFGSRRETAARLVDRVVDAVRATERDATSMAAPVAAAPAWAWRQLLVGLAAGFLLAVGLFRPWQSRSDRPDVVTAPSAPVARLALATGPVEMKEASQIVFFTCPKDAPISKDSVVRTGHSTRCEIALDDGNAVRLDCDTEVTLRKSKVVEVSRGRLASTSPPGNAGLEIQSGGGKIVAKPAAQLAVTCEPQGARVIVVDGTANVQTGDKSLEVGPGKQVRIAQGKVIDGPDWCDTSLETAWVNSVLAIRNSEHPELVERVNRLLANVGAAKLSLMYEDELRRLGDDGVPPLLAYLASTRDKPNTQERSMAATIVADVAQPRWIPDLIGLLVDPNPNVRFDAARGLERLTGRDQGRKPETWRSESWNSCEATYDKWLDWWKKNHDRYPAARREVPAAKPQSF
jgi:hypothetical protein